jgi:fatty acid synthase
VKSGYQKRRLNIWQKNSVKVITSKLNIKRLDETEQLFTLALTLGPIGGIFHLAAVRCFGFIVLFIICIFLLFCLFID